MKGMIYGLVGRSLKHSYSVPIHQELGCPGYRLYELEPDGLARFFDENDIGGINVTIPYKREVISFCHELTETASVTGSVNTVIRRPDGSLLGHNTDVYGLEYMARRAGIDMKGKKVVIFGSGGASQTARYCASSAGAAEIVTVSRSGEDNYENLGRHYDADVLINTTPVGMYPSPGVSVADVSLFTHCTGVLDLIYNPQRTSLIMQAQALGIPCSNGLPMLVAQAKAAEELFFGRTIPDSEIVRILELMCREMTNIVIIGMPGSGKSSVGVALARLTGRRLVDTDEVVERTSGRIISDIFAEHGEDEFRRMEREAVADTGMMSGVIITTGGGCIKDIRNRAPLHQNGRIYHIERDTSLLAREGRPLSLNSDLDSMYRERAPLYAAFRDIRIDNNTTVDDAADRIWREFCESFSD